jgi:hypothetical protein
LPGCTAPNELCSSAAIAAWLSAAAIPAPKATPPPPMHRARAVAPPTMNIVVRLRCERFGGVASVEVTTYAATGVFSSMVVLLCKWQAGQVGG